MNRISGSPDEKRIEDFIKSLGEPELIYLNKLVVERLKLLFQEKSTKQMMRFNIGERVAFAGHSGEPKRGVIVRLNKKTATIQTTDGEHWNVAPNFLTREDRA